MSMCVGVCAERGWSAEEFIFYVFFFVFLQIRLCFLSS